MSRIGGTGVIFADESPCKWRTGGGGPTREADLPMIYVLIVVALIVALWVFMRVIYPAFGRIDYDEVVKDLDREEAHDMLDKHVRHLAMSIVLPGHFHAGERDVEAAAAAMARIFEIEGEYRDRDEIRDFVRKLAKDKADAMVKDADKHPILFDDLWLL
jgi:hypothetical protein